MIDTSTRLSLDIRLSAADVFLQLEEIGRELDVVLEVVLRIEVVRLLVGLVLLNVQTDGSTTAASAGQTNDDAASVVEFDEDTLVLANAAIEIGVREVIGLDDLAAGDGGADESVLLGGDELLHVGNHLVGTLALAALVVVAGEESTPVDVPEVLLNGANAGSSTSLLTDTGDDVEPCYHGPKTVLLADMVASCAETLLSANVHLVGIEETAEELPTGGHLVALDALLLRDKVDSTRGGHASGKTVDALLLEPGNELGVVSNDGQAVSGGDESVSTVDHVTVTITIAGSTEVDAVLVNCVDERFGVDKVGVGVVAAEVGLGHAVLGAVGDAELFLEDVDTVVAGNTAQAVKEKLEVGVVLEKLLDQVEVEDVLEHFKVVLGRVDNLDLKRSVLL